jgi:hypothetical protein
VAARATVSAAVAAVSVALSATVTAAVVAVALAAASVLGRVAISGDLAGLLLGGGSRVEEGLDVQA